MSSPMTIVKDESMVVDTSVPLKSMDTRGKSDTANTPCSTTSTSYMRCLVILKRNRQVRHSHETLQHHKHSFFLVTYNA